MDRKHKASKNEVVRRSKKQKENQEEQSLQYSLEMLPGHILVALFDCLEQYHDILMIRSLAQTCHVMQSLYWTHSVSLNLRVTTLVKKDIKKFALPTSVERQEQKIDSLIQELKSLKEDLGLASVLKEQQKIWNEFLTVAGCNELQKVFLREQLFNLVRYTVVKDKARGNNYLLREKFKGFIDNLPMSGSYYHCYFFGENWSDMTFGPAYISWSYTLDTQHPITYENIEVLQTLLDIPDHIVPKALFIRALVRVAWFWREGECKSLKEIENL